MVKIFMSIAERIKNARKAKGITQIQLARVLGTRQSTVSNWEKGNAEPKRQALRALSTLLDIPLAVLEFGEDPEVWDGPKVKRRLIQVVGYVGAGGEINPIDDHAMGNGLEEVEAPPQSPPGTVAVIVRGDSMIPMLYDGMLVFFSSRLKNVVDYVNMPPIIVHLEDGRKAIKGITNGSSRGLYTLTSFNAGPITDVKVESVSPIDWIKPV